jgi:transposase
MSAEETQLLESYFERFNGVVTKKSRQQIAKELNWTPSGVYNWFRRKRAKTNKSPTKKTQKVATSSQSEVNKTAETKEQAEFLKIKIPISVLREANKAPSNGLSFCCVN